MTSAFFFAGRQRPCFFPRTEGAVVNVGGTEHAPRIGRDPRT
jgi:hypothetical protein